MHCFTGGDHGKGVLVFVAVIVVRYKEDTKDPLVLELQIGQIDSNKDDIELLKPLLIKLSDGFKKLGFENGISYARKEATGELSFHTSTSSNSESISIGTLFDGRL